MMEDIIINDNYLILIINNIKGNITRLNLILEKIEKEMDINYLFLTGEVFTLKINEKDILSISFKGNIFIFDSSPLGEIIKSKYEYNIYTLKNIVFLGRSGIFSPKNSSLNIAYLSGNEVKEFLDKNTDNSNLSYTNIYYNYKDIENLIKNYIEIKNRNNNNKIDFFLINNFPECLYNRYINSIKEESKNKNSKLNEEQINMSISYSLNYLLYIMNPRYVISSVDDFFYKNTEDNVINNAGYRTLFYNLAYCEDKQNINENFYVAFDYKSINDMNEDEILSLKQEYEKQLGIKLVNNNNLFEYFNNLKINNDKSLIENYDNYIKLCFLFNYIKSIKEKKQEAKSLYLTNINYNTTEDEIKNYLIQRYGPIKQIKLLVNKENNKFNGKVIVQFQDINSMKDMLNNSSKEKFKDRNIKAIIYTPKDKLNTNNSKSNNNSNNNFTNNLNIISSNNLSLNSFENNTSNLSLNKENSNTSNNNIDEDKKCWFCYEHNSDLDKRFILTDFQYFYLSFSKGPINKYHFLIIPKRHISFYSSLTKEEKIECEMIIKILEKFLNTKTCDFIIFEKNLKYNFAKSIHMLINVIGIEKTYLSKLNEFCENFLIEEKIYNYIVNYNEENIYLYSTNKNEEYIYINIPKIIKEKIIRKIILMETKEYKIDYPRKMICLLINKEDRTNWRNTLDLGDKMLEELKKEINPFLNNFFSNIQ